MQNLSDTALRNVNRLHNIRPAAITACAALLLYCSGCRQTPADTLFTALPVAETGISFENRLPEQTAEGGMNIIQYLYYYNGGGVAAGDVNNDGLTDLYFTSNVDKNRLYLNKGGFKFEDVTEKAGVGGSGSWKTGVAMADVNADGWLDIYVCQVGNYKSFRGKNQLFINNRDGSFTDRAEEYGLDLSAFCTQAAFFDYDRDGDLDCFVLCHSVHSPESYKDTSISRRYDALASDRLFRNEAISLAASVGNPSPSPSPKGEGGRRVDSVDAASPLPFRRGVEGGVYFTDITAQSGLRDGKSGYGLGLAIGDVNGDGYPDIYVANDFHENDFLYYSVEGQYFKEGITQSVGHTSNFSMGCDMADFNNDERPDIVTLDMKPEDEIILKSSQPGDQYPVYQFKHSYGYHWQFPRNNLQLNRGTGDGGRWTVDGRRGTVDGLPRPFGGGQTAEFSEIGQLAGMATTDWSWSALLADFDLDGWKDLYITNGIPHRPNDMDYLQFISSAAVQRQASDLEIISKIPSGIEANYCFRNKTDLRFEDVSAKWGLAQTGCSNGAVYADLDNDGDPDLVTNNLNQPASVYKNNTKGRNFLKIQLKGAALNPFAVGASVTLESSDGPRQMQYLQPVRGFQSSVEPLLLFGLDTLSAVSAIYIQWPDGTTQQIPGPVAANQTLRIRQEAAPTGPGTPAAGNPVLTPSPTPLPAHRERQADDITREKLLPWSLGTQGPKLAAGDVNRDGLDDFYIPGPSGGQLVLQTKQGFAAPKQLLKYTFAWNETCAVFFDANGDGAPDLYVGTGGNQLSGDQPGLADFLWLNDGRGNFEDHSSGLLPKMAENTACVRPGDFDGDGDLDLFVGGRSVTGAYGMAPNSFLLENDGAGHFTDASARAAGLGRIGMVTDAQWADINGDQRPDLVVCGEWMPLTVFQNTGSGFVKTEIPHSSGLWNSIAAADMDGDGDTDLIAGNFGLNSIFRASPEEPLGLWVKDLDQNGATDPVLSYYRQGKNRVFADKDWLTGQLPMVKKNFVQYRKYAESTFDDVFPAAMWAGAVHRTAEVLESCWVENRGKAAWALHPLPAEAQFSPVTAILTGDFDGDGYPDMLLGGNWYEVQPAIGRQDASCGTYLRGDGKGGFVAMPAGQSGFRLRGAVRDLKMIRKTGNRYSILAAINNGPAQEFELHPNTKTPKH